MADINPTLDKFAAKRYRYFPKHALADYEEVGPYSASVKLRLPAEAAMMMLVCTKDEQFGSVVARLASVGRPRVPKAAPLASASFHDFSATEAGRGRPPRSHDRPGSLADTLISSR